VPHSLRQITSRKLPDDLKALTEYVSAVVGFVDDDLELPLPDGDLAELVAEVTLHGPSADNRAPRPEQQPLPERRHCSAQHPPSRRDAAGCAEGPSRWAQQDIEAALRHCEETVAC
jgi:hypothetical protein